MYFQDLKLTLIHIQYWIKILTSIIDNSITKQCGISYDIQSQHKHVNIFDNEKLGFY